MNVNTKEVIKNYYNIENNDQLEKHLDLILKKAQDPMKEQREQACGQFRANATENIINDLISQIK